MRSSSPEGVETTRSGAASSRRRAPSGGGGELDAGDGTEGLVAVVDGAADEVGDVGGVRFEGPTFGKRYEDLFAGELRGLLDAIDSVEVQDDAASVATDGKPVRGDLGDLGGAIGAIGGDVDVGLAAVKSTAI